MGKIENDELRKLKNAKFMKAFKYVAEKLKMNQGQLAEAIGSKSAYISNFSKGIRPVPEETIDALINMSAKIPNGQIFREYLLGNSEIMLLVNVTNEEMIAAKRRAVDPDYDVMQARLKEKEKQLDAELTYIDPSSQQNASIAVYVQYTNRLSDDLKKKEIEMAERLAEKDAVIAALKRTVADKEKELERTIADKDEIIRLKVERISYLEDELSKIRLSDITDYHFPIGAAENKNVYPQK